MKRGEIWTVSGGPGYAGKPRPAIIVQDDLWPNKAFATFCGLTTEVAPNELMRPLIAPTEDNGLLQPSWVMIDRILSAPRSKFGNLVGRLSDPDIDKVDRTLLLFLGLAR